MSSLQPSGSRTADGSSPARESSSGPQRSRHVIRHLELHVAHTCNLTCESCSHYSNHRHKGILSLEEAERWLQAWAPRVNPVTFKLLGGEPTLNPDLTGFLRLARRTWPESNLRIITNGWYLHRHPELPEFLASDRATRLQISVHHDSAEYRAKLEPIFELADRWTLEHGVRIDIEQSWERWTRRYRGTGSAMEPFEDGRPAESWEHCVAKHTPQLHEGKIWKCAPLAYLGLQHRTVGLSEKWAHYLAYEPLSPECSDEELLEFFSRREESHCGMCPARPEHLVLPMPFSSAPVSAEKYSASPARLPSQVQSIPVPLAPEEAVEFKMFPILCGPTSIVTELESHASVLGPARSPHPPHTHVEEEILIVLEGQAELVLPAFGASTGLERVLMGPGAFAYYPAFSPHTIWNPGPKPVSYLMFKWRSTQRRDERNPARLFAEFPRRVTGSPHVPPPPVTQCAVLDTRTGHLENLHCHVTLLQPGSGYPEHADAYDVAIVVLQGSVETLGRRVEPHGVIFYAAGEPHGMRNPGTEPALYLVFEFHGRPALPASASPAESLQSSPLNA